MEYERHGKLECCVTEYDLKRGPSVVGGRKVVKAEWNDTFSELLV